MSKFKRTSYRVDYQDKNIGDYHFDLLFDIRDLERFSACADEVCKEGGLLKLKSRA